jgi:CRISPR/Cas system endoribonuclease Cas6 (RAMP superfamily)
MREFIYESFLNFYKCLLNFQKQKKHFLERKPVIKKSQKNEIILPLPISLLHQNLLVYFKILGISFLQILKEQEGTN